MIVLHYSDKRADDFPALYEKCDVLVTTGDLDLADFGFLGDGNKLLAKPAFGVYGNHDGDRYLEELGLINLHGKTVDFGGMRWGGFQGCLKYKDSDLMYTEDQAKDFADNFPPVDVLLLHAGPLGMLDDPSDSIHIGSRHIRRYVLENHPKLVFVGHQYSDEEMHCQEVKIFRTFGARLIEV